MTYIIHGNQSGFAVQIEAEYAEAVVHKSKGDARFSEPSLLYSLKSSSGPTPSVTADTAEVSKAAAAVQKIFDNAEALPSDPSVFMLGFDGEIGLTIKTWVIRDGYSNATADLKIWLGIIAQLTGLPVEGLLYRVDAESWRTMRLLLPREAYEEMFQHVSPTTMAELV